MAFDVFLDLDGIDGESMQKGYEGAIEVLSYSWLVGPAPSATGSPQLTALVVNKNIDVASPPLFDAACSGQVISSGRLRVRAAGKVQYEPLRLDMNNIKVIRLTPSVSPLSALEQVQLQFSGATIEIKEQTETGQVISVGTATCGS
jgi:type VI secretion system secreted protein Hcp